MTLILNGWVKINCSFREETFYMVESCLKILFGVEAGLLVNWRRALQDCVWCRKDDEAAVVENSVDVGVWDIDFPRRVCNVLSER